MRRSDTKRWPLAAMLLLLVAILAGGVSAQAAPTALQVPTGPSEGVITATTFFTQSIEVVTPPDAPAPIDQELLNKGGFFDPALEIDNGANLFLGYVRNDGLTAQGRVLRKAPSGQITGRWEVNIGSIQGWQHKADGLAAVISGDNLLVTLTSHATNPTGPRIMALWGAQIDNVAVPYPNGVRPTGAPGGNVGGGSTGGGCETCPTLAEISGLLDVKLAAQLQAIRNEFGGNIRQGIEDKTKSAIEELGVLRVGSTADDRYAMLRHDTRDGAYEALRSFFPTPPPAATATPPR